MSFINPIMDIAIAALLLTVVSQLIQRKLFDREKLKKNQEKMKQHQQKMKELAQKQDKQSKQEIEKMEKEFMETASETMGHSLKQMAISTPIFLIAFVYLGSAYGSEIIKLPVPLPWFGSNGIQLFSETSWVGWYVVSAIVISLVVNAAITVAEKLGFKI